MIKFKQEKDGYIILGFGLTEANIELLKQGSPIRIDMPALGLPNGHIGIFYGETKQKIIEQIKDHIGPETKIVVEGTSHEKHGTADGPIN